MIRLGALISGTGRTLQNLIDRIHDGRLKASIKVVVSSREGVKGIERARAAGIPTFVVPRSGYASDREFSGEITRILDRYRPQLLIMAGFLNLYLFPESYRGRVLNVHPALLPKFGGRGFYGHRVHEAVLRAGETESGCTVHFADQLYDHGPIILQRRVKVRPDDTPDTLAERVFQEECEAYPEAIRLVASGGATFESGRSETSPGGRNVL